MSLQWVFSATVPHYPPEGAKMAGTTWQEHRGIKDLQDGVTPTVPSPERWGAYVAPAIPPSPTMTVPLK